MRKRILAAKKTRVLIGAGLFLLSSMPGYAGFPVFDGTNLSQNIVTAINQVTQVSKQIQQYQTQLNQYEVALRNTVAPAVYIWDQAQTTMNNLVNATDTLNYYKTQLGSMNGYLNKFRDVSFYSTSPCFNASGSCTAAQIQSIRNSMQWQIDAEKKANDAAMKGLDMQQASLSSDASRLRNLQSSAQGASGQLEAIGYANQLASSQTNQLLQIRSLLVSNQIAVATRQQVLADREAREQASSNSLRKNTMVSSPTTTWNDSDF
jgi:P-type conjugative transfer protein TrbJ